MKNFLIFISMSLLILFYQNCTDLESVTSDQLNLSSTDNLKKEEPNPNLIESPEPQSDKSPEYQVEAEVDQPVILGLKLVHNIDASKELDLTNDLIVDPAFFPDDDVSVHIITNENTLSTRIQTNGESDIDSLAPYTSAGNFIFVEGGEYEIEAYPFSGLERKGVKGSAFKMYFKIKQVTEKPSQPKGLWDVTTKAPILTNPIRIEISDQSQTQRVSDFNRLGCEGVYYKIDIPAGKDAEIRMAKGSKPLKYPVWVSGGRNVHVIGVDLNLVVQKGCDTGEANNYPSKADPSKGLVDGRNFKNIHPRLPGGMAMRLNQSGTSFVEGVNIDINGMEADCFVIRNQLDAVDIKKQYTASDGRLRLSKDTINKFLKERHVKIINTRCVGVESLDNDFKKIGDGIHGDFLQNQGSDNIGTLTLENIVYLMSGNGITLHRWNGVSMKDFKMRNYYHSWDKRFATDDAYDRGAGLIFTAAAEKYSFENVWTNEYIKNLNYGILNDIRIGAGQSGIRKMPGMFKGVPPKDFAPVNQVGINYQSPY